ncbi:DNA replication complex gins protein psf1, partial [Globisporangium splendens]
MALCTKGKELLRELQRSDWLPPYNDELVRQVVEEVGSLHEQIMEKLRVFGDEIEQQPSVHCGLIVSHQCLLRNKRCLLAYLYERTEKIKNLRWETGTIIPAPLAPNLCQREVQFFQSYDQLLTDYMADFEIDLSADTEPPKDLYVEVRVLRDCGEIMTENGLVNLEANSTHFLRRVDVEQLIRQGLLEQIKH